MVRLGTNGYTGQPANRTEMRRVSRAKGQGRFDGCRCDQSIGQLNAAGESVLFDEGGGCVANGFGKGQDSGLELAKRLLC